MRKFCHLSIASALVLFTLLLITNSCYAQKVEKSEEEILKDKEAILEKQDANPTSTSSLFFERAEDSVLDREAISPKSAVEFNASKGDSNVSLRIGKEFSSGRRGKLTSWSLTATSPVNKQDDITQLATLDGLANSFRLDFSYTDFILTGRRNPNSRKEQEEIYKICKIVGIDISKQQPCQRDNFKAGLKKKDLPETEQSALLNEYDSYFINEKSWNITYGLKTSVGYKNFEFINSETLEKEDQDEIPWSAGGFFGFTPPKFKNALFLVGAEYQSAFKPSSTQTICPASNSTTPVTCTTGNIGEPNQQDKILTYIEGRGSLLKTAFSLRVTHDFENDNTGIDLPIYLFRNKEDNLNGGLRLGWTDANDDNDLSFGVFVGSKFKLF